VRGDIYQPGVISAGELEIDTNGHRVILKGTQIRLTRIEFKILATLAQHPGQTFSRSQVLDRLHGNVVEGYDRSVDAHIKNLRRKIENDPSEPQYILTVYGVGYKFTDEF
jgi:DNA-binding response OmpR family regulator